MGTLATNSPADLIADYLAAQSVPPFGGATGWTLYVGNMPESPDQIVCIMDASAPSGIPNLLLEWAGIQILVRSNRDPSAYPLAYVKARQIRDYLLGMPNAPAQFVELDGCVERGSISPLGVDDANRQRFSNNFMLTLEPLPNAITHRMSL